MHGQATLCACCGHPVATYTCISLLCCDSPSLLCRAASQMMRQIHFATVDLELHARYQPGGEQTIFDVDRRIAERTTVMPPLPEDR